MTVCGAGWGCCYGDHGCNCSETTLSYGIGHAQTSLAIYRVSATSNTASTTGTLTATNTPESGSQSIVVIQATGAFRYPSNTTTSGLSSGATIGIGVGGATAGTSILIVFVLAFPYVKRKRSRVSLPKDFLPQSLIDGVPELHDKHLIEADSHLIFSRGDQREYLAPVNESPCEVS